MDSYRGKYLKYKLKYNNLRKYYGGGGDEDATKKDDPTKNIIDIIELYNKAFNSYVVYRFRFNHMFGLVPGLTVLSNTVNKYIKMKNISDFFKNFYVENVGTKKENVYEASRAQRLFSLRQQTTKVIKHMLLKNDEAKTNIEKLKTEIQEHLSSENPEEKEEQNELINKCNLISSLTELPEEEKSFEELINPKGLDVLRNITNKIIFKLSKQKEESGNNETNNGLNCELNNLFTQCFELLKQEFDQLST